MAEVTSPLKVNPSYDPDLMIDLVATQEPSRFLAGGDFRLSLNCIGKYALDAAQMNGKYADNLLVIQIAVIRDPKKRGQILEELGIDPD